MEWFLEGESAAMEVVNSLRKPDEEIDEKWVHRSRMELHLILVGANKPDGSQHDGYLRICPNSTDRVFVRPMAPLAYVVDMPFSRLTNMLERLSGTNGAPTGSGPNTRFR